MATPRSTFVLRGRPSWALGVATMLGGVAVTTAAIAALRHHAPVVSLSIVYLVPILAVSAYWGIVLGLATSLLSALSFNFFFLGPTGRLTIADSRNWTALVAFFVVALVTSTMAETTRARAAEAEARRREADLGADLARTLLGAPKLSESLAMVSHRLAELLDARSASVELGAVAPDDRRLVIPLREDDRPVGSLVLPADLPPAQQARVRERIVPVLESVLAAALQRERLQADVVETAALRRSDEIKTAVLRSVSHDLRTPVTAILAAATALRSSSLTPRERAEVQDDVVASAATLSVLIDQLLDLSRLQAGTAEPNREWSSIEEALHEAAAHAASDPSVFAFSIDHDLPLVRADAAQLERAFANLLENAARYGDGLPVSVRARAVGERVLVRIVDRGPGIPLAEQERIFTPFYRGAATAHRVPGSGLGLAIARGFVEANGGTLNVESLPGQGTTFVIALPVERVPA
ncbi:MAG TPA: ATP-binding protein [Baekduia sp.]|uniref:sensor histidine kinase n=1 Tax=Baekduia sp. TaxID=2600305 RepID=UPI002D76DBA8|nr:ATP-binding protein [Baekduia sp.]HET6506136.1 ATP-binding protein [Baekduia sp.]